MGDRWQLSSSRWDLDENGMAVEQRQPRSGADGVTSPPFGESLRNMFVFVAPIQGRQIKDHKTS